MHVLQPLPEGIDAEPFRRHEREQTLGPLNHVLPV